MTVDVARPPLPATPRSVAAAPASTAPTPDKAPSAPPAPVRRRLTAWAVDLTLVALAPAVVAVTQASATTPDPAAPFAPDPSWLTVAGTGYRWTTGGIALTAAAALLSALIVLTLIPANTTGWTPGLRLVRLRVTTTGGTRAQLHHHLVRTVFGLVDLAPFVVPGLLGWYLAHRSPLHQRLGDRLARTMVVDYRHPERPVDPGPARRAPSGPLAAATTPSGPRPSSGPLAASVASRQAPAAPTTLPEAARRWKIERGDAPAGPTLPPILPDTVQVNVPAPTHRRTPGGPDAGRGGGPMAGLANGTGPSPARRRPDPTTAPASRLTVSVPRRRPGPGSASEPELVPEWNERCQAWVVRDATSGLLFRHDAATGDWLPL